MKHNHKIIILNKMIICKIMAEIFIFKYSFYFSRRVPAQNDHEMFETLAVSTQLLLLPTTWVSWVSVIIENSGDARERDRFRLAESMDELV